ncbi:hypothetical protein [Ammoniphilus sp. CFH 90114]|uniref:hypothetical protein n=1 Tax=Ammoniphilus sp. CFH 90114 TaxID=2493665 RepID=UPI001010077B|nr:hypothetical protein [Ammoniphilus sp. CFH 90114]RXT03652.1 hypothetical protein EIZ39_23270 [Ammoniphilus sp. CFH 90114]
MTMLVICIILGIFILDHFLDVALEKRNDRLFNQHILSLDPAIQRKLQEQRECWKIQIYMNGEGLT